MSEHENEALNSIVNLDGQGEDPAVKELLSPEFATKSNKEANEIALMIQQIVRGELSLLGKQMGDEIARVNERMARYDEEAERRDKENKKFVEDILDKAEKLKTVGIAKDKLVAEGGELYKNAFIEAKAAMVVDKQQFDYELDHQEKILVRSPGVWESIMVNGQPSNRLLPEVIRIKHRTFVIQPNVPTMVPKAVADALQDRISSQMETAERQEVMAKHLEYNQLNDEMARISAKYHTKTDIAPPR